MGLRIKHMGLGQPDLGVNRSSVTCSCVTLEAQGCPQSSNMGTLPRPRDCCEDEMRYINA